MTVPEISTERHEAVARGLRAAARLRALPDMGEVVRGHQAIIGDLFYSDREAWDSVQTLEDLVLRRGLVTLEEVERERAEQQAARRADLDAFLVQLWGPTMAPPPHARACQECTAEPGEPCRPWCTGLDTASH